MTEINFTKMHGLGNDFVLIDSRKVPLEQIELKKLAMAPENTYYDASGEVKRVTGVKQITNKTFYFQNNAWVDNEYRPEQTLIQVKRFSEAYFQLSRAVPNMNQNLALGEDVIVNIGNQSFQIGEDGKTHFSQKELKAFF